MATGADASGGVRGLSGSERLGEMVLAQPRPLQRSASARAALELLAFGRHVEGDAEFVPDWWGD